MRIPRTLLAFWASGLILTLALGQDSDLKSKAVHEKEELDKSPVAKLYPPALSTKVQQLLTQVGQTTDPVKAGIFVQQARWLVPDPALTPPEHVSKIFGSLKFKHEHYPTAVVYA